MLPNCSSHTQTQDSVCDTLADAMDRVEVLYDESCTNETAGCISAGIPCRFCSHRPQGHDNFPPCHSDSSFNATDCDAIVQDPSVVSTFEPRCAASAPVVPSCFGDQVPCQVCSLTSHPVFTLCSEMNHQVTILQTPVNQDVSEFSHSNLVGLVLLGVAVLCGLLVAIREKVKLRQEIAEHRENSDDFDRLPMSDRASSNVNTALESV